jgi:hypothetical protein
MRVMRERVLSAAALSGEIRTAIDSLAQYSQEADLLEESLPVGRASGRGQIFGFSGKGSRWRHAAKSAAERVIEPPSSSKSSSLNAIATRYASGVLKSCLSEDANFVRTIATPFELRLAFLSEILYRGRGLGSGSPMLLVWMLQDVESTLSFLRSVNALRVREVELFEGKLDFFRRVNDEATKARLRLIHEVREASADARQAYKNHVRIAEGLHVALEAAAMVVESTQREKQLKEARREYDNRVATAGKTTQAIVQSLNDALEKAEQSGTSITLTKDLAKIALDVSLEKARRTYSSALREASSASSYRRRMLEIEDIRIKGLDRICDDVCELCEQLKADSAGIPDFLRPPAAVPHAKL